jgi:hypothetical protein
MIHPAAAPNALSHADLAGLWESAGSERDGHAPGSERYHFPVAGTLWIERGTHAPMDFHSYQLGPQGILLDRQHSALTAWIEAGFLILRGEDEHETWCRKVSAPGA